MKYENYTIEELQPGLFAIDDAKDNSMYLIVGTKKALLIDTCCMEDPILPMLRTLTDKPIELALTHAHIDHMYHSDEFKTVYLHENDIAAWKWDSLKLVTALGHMMFHMPYKKYNVKRFIPITENTIIDLGGNKISVIHAFGHTPGSCIFVDKEHTTLFMGDSIGNGGGPVWLWLPGSSDISVYRKTLARLIKNLEPYKTYRFLGGHRPQTFPSQTEPKGHPLNIAVVRAMHILCSKILTNKIQPVSKQKYFIVTAWRYVYGSAHILVCRDKIR